MFSIKVDVLSPVDCCEEESHETSRCRLAAKKGLGKTFSAKLGTHRRRRDPCIHSPVVCFAGLQIPPPGAWQPTINVTDRGQVARVQIQVRQTDPRAAQGYLPSMAGKRVNMKAG